MVTLDSETTDIEINEIKDIENKIKINKLIIDEIYPTESSYFRGLIFEENELSANIQSFFGKHIENIISSPTTRSGRFNNKTSTILNNFNNLLNIERNQLQEFEKKAITDKLYEHMDTSEITQDLIDFYYHSEKITNKLIDSIGKKARNPFLFVILHCTHIHDGELIAIMKMERVFGVRYSEKKLSEQLDLLPDKSKALQKGAIIFKKYLLQYPVEANYRENALEDVFHTRLRDGQDDNISQYFMKGLLDNSIVFRDKENTQAAITQTKLFLSPFLNEGCKPESIQTYIYENLQYGKETSVSRIVEDVILNSQLINQKLIKKANEDLESLSSKIFQKMLDLNPSSSASFKAEYPKVDRYTFTDTMSDGKGKYIKMSIAKSLISKGDVKVNIDLEDEEIDTSEMVLIGFNSDILNIDLNIDNEK